MSFSLTEEYFDEKNTAQHGRNRFTVLLLHSFAKNTDVPFQFLTVANQLNSFHKVQRMTYLLNLHYMTGFYSLWNQLFLKHAGTKENRLSKL